MRSIWRTAGPALTRDILALAVADLFVGVSFGAIAASGGMPMWAVVAMSLLVFAGGAQFLAAGLVVADPVAAVLGGLLLNARHLPFGMAVGDILGRGPARLVGSHIMVDESVAFAMAQPDRSRRHAAYWLTGVVLFVTWNAGTVLGALVGGAVGNPDTYGLDAAFPAGLFALLLPTLRRPREAPPQGARTPADSPGVESPGVESPGAESSGVESLGAESPGAARYDSAAPWVAGAGALIAVLATPLTPAGLPVLLALGALGLALVVPTRRAAVPC